MLCILKFVQILTGVPTRLTERVFQEDIFAWDRVGCNYSLSRAQKVILLSSGEAEVYSASSAACDSILLAKIISCLPGCGVAPPFGFECGKRNLVKAGVRRIRHLSCRILCRLG